MNRSSFPLLKQFVNLKPSDFERHPIWISCHSADIEEEWYDDTDEETFRPLSKKDILDLSEEMYLVKATFVLKDGSELKGFFTPQDTNENGDDISYIQPYVFLKDEMFGFWSGIISPTEIIEQFYRTLQKVPAQVFPIHYYTNTIAAKGQIKGQIKGFDHIAKSFE